MKKYLLYIFLISFTACSNENNKEQAISEPTDKIALNKDKIEYTLIKDNLYSDENGSLYLKSINNEDLENGTKHDVWLKTVYCDTCWTPTKNGWTDITELKDFVDMATFHLDTSDAQQGGDIYADKNYRYFHKWMADGGTITLMEK